MPEFRHLRWEIGEAVEKTCEWTKVWLNGGSVPEEMDRQIEAFQSSATKGEEE